jgi:3-methyl-2-oxobutanoate hydroxymethyltransferase
MKKTIEYFKQKKARHEKISALTSYDYPTTKLLEEAGIDMIILGDSLGTNILGYRDETEVTMEDMVHHTRAVCRALRDIFLVVDLPYHTHETPEDAVKNAKVLTALGADAVKFEGIKPAILAALKGSRLNVMCHIGLNPQYDQERMKSGNISRGKESSEAVEIIEGARVLEKGGMDLVILEKIPERIARIVGIGAGKYCDGQVLIINDVLGINDRQLKHVPQYAALRDDIKGVVKRYRHEIDEEIFPGKEHINIIKNEEYDKVAAWCREHGFQV